MSSNNNPNYPVNIWDGKTPSRDRPGDFRSPDYEDWDQVVAEVIALQQVVSRRVSVPVLEATVIQVGDLVWLDGSGNVKPASDYTWNTNLATTQAAFAADFLGIAVEASADGETTPILVETSAIIPYTFTVASGNFKIGDALGPDENPATTLSNTILEIVGSDGLGIARSIEHKSSATKLKVTLASAFTPFNTNASLG